MTPNEAWETYVGRQSAAEFLANGGLVGRYLDEIAGGPLAPPAEEREEVERLLLAYIEAQADAEASGATWV